MCFQNGLRLLSGNKHHVFPVWLLSPFGCDSSSVSWVGLSMRYRWPLVNIKALAFCNTGYHSNEKACLQFFNARRQTQFCVFSCLFLSSTACTASLVKVLAPRSARKKRRRKPLTLWLLLRCSKGAPSSRATCSLISDGAVSIPLPPGQEAPSLASFCHCGSWSSPWATTEIWA